MTLGQLLDDVRAMPLSLDAISQDLCTGAWRSVFKGQGMEFDEVRQYQWGDDIRLIDRNVTARFAHSVHARPWVKRYREEREVSVFMLIDCSASMSTGAGPRSRREQAARAAAILALSAERLGSSLGAVSFDGELARVLPAAKGRHQVLDVLRAALGEGPGGAAPRGSGGRAGRAVPALHGVPGTALAAALEAAFRVQRRRALIVVISDFMASRWESPLARLAARHDVMAIHVQDPVEKEFPRIGFQVLCDPETGAEARVSTGSRHFREAWTRWHMDRTRYLAAQCARSGVRLLPLSTVDDPFHVLHSRLGRGGGL